MTHNFSGSPRKLAYSTRFTWKSPLFRSRALPFRFFRAKMHDVAKAFPANKCRIFISSSSSTKPVECLAASKDPSSEVSAKDNKQAISPKVGERYNSQAKVSFARATNQDVRSRAKESDQGVRAVQESFSARREPPNLKLILPPYTQL